MVNLSYEEEVTFLCSRILVFSSSMYLKCFCLHLTELAIPTPKTQQGGDCLYELRVCLCRKQT